jgi:hypothetical protein
LYRRNQNRISNAPSSMRNSGCQVQNALKIALLLANEKLESSAVAPAPNSSA